MDADLRQLLDAALACPECEAPTSEEIRHGKTPEGWRATGAIVVCRNGCRIEVEPYPLTDYLPDWDPLTDNHIVLAEVEEDGVRYRLLANRLSPEVFNGEAEGRPAGAQGRSREGMRRACLLLAATYLAGPHLLRYLLTQIYQPPSLDDLDLLLAWPSGIAPSPSSYQRNERTNSEPASPTTPSATPTSTYARATSP